MALGVQVVFRAVDDRVLAPTPAARRAFVGVMLRVGRRFDLFACGLADSHGHAGLAREDVSQFVHDARIALSHALDVPVGTPTRWPIRDTWHAEKVLGYVHRQDQHHGVELDPLREGTTLPALFGLRIDGLWLPDRVRSLLPRLTRADLLAQWGIPSLAEGDALEHLADSAAAAAGVGALVGLSTPVVEARRAAVHACRDTPASQVADALAVTPRCVRKLRLQEPDAALVRAVRLQVGLRAVAPAPRSLVGGEPGEPFTA